MSSEAMTGEAVLTVAQMRAAEQAAALAGVDEWDLMRRAGEGAARWVARMAGSREVCVLCGPGNNGGDGYVIAAALMREGGRVEVVAPRPPATAAARRARAGFSGKVHEAHPVNAPVLVDCLFGYGLNADLAEPYAGILEGMGNAAGIRIAVDLPSGIEADTGRLRANVPPFDLTVALGAWKLAHFMSPAAGLMGAKRLVPLGIETQSRTGRLSCQPRLDPPAADAHKYSRGLLAIIGGTMTGAAVLAAGAAMRAGAGYVVLLSESSHPAAPADLVVRHGALADELADDRTSAYLIGPGLGRDEEARRRLSQVLERGRPTVIDADGLHFLDPDLLEGCDPSRLILTPHDGELAALCTAFGISADSRLAKASALSGATGMIVLAKGPDTYLAAAGDRVFFPRASAWLSTAGTGDVLAGIIASRLAAHGDPAHAAEEGVWIHAEAARIAAPAFSASELVRAVRPAIGAFL